MVAFLALLVVVGVAGLTSADDFSKISRIINGENASPGEFPHQITLLRNGYHTCGGSVIADEWVLTAAHCVDGQVASSLAIVADLHVFSTPGNTYKLFEVESIIMHNNYNKGTGGFPNDIALLKLKPNNHVLHDNIIPLSSGSHSYADEQCYISGWGVTEDGTAADILQKAFVTVKNNTYCKEAWGASAILTQHICVKGYGHSNTGSGACNGDSGGPLECSGQLAGVTSWGKSGCHDEGQVDYPSVYVRVSEFYTWIKANCGNCVS